MASKILTGALLGPRFAPDVIIEEQQVAGTSAGTFTAGSWATRALNTLVRNNGSLASYASNQVTLPAGTYYFKWTATVYSVNNHKSKIRNVTDSTDVAVSISSYANNATAVGNNSEGSTVVTIAASKTFALQHQCSLTQGTNGFGNANNLGVVEVYSRLEITRLA